MPSAPPLCCDVSKGRIESALAALLVECHQVVPVPLAMQSGQKDDRMIVACQMVTVHTRM
jgi:hypothetical protein